MTAPRLDTPDLGEPLSANPVLEGGLSREEPASTALDNSRPSAGSPLKSSTTAADLDPTSQATPAATGLDGSSAGQSGQQGSVESVLGAIGGAVASAPAAAFEALTGKTNAALAGTPVGDKLSAATANLPSLQQVQSQASQVASSASASASTYLQKAVNQLPPSVSAYIPASLTSPTSSGAVPTHHSEAEITSQSRETTSAPIAESRSDRPEGVLKPLVPETSSDASATQAAKPSSVGGSDFTKPHTTGNFEAAGSLQATHNPELVQAQSDLAVRAESGDL